MNKCENINIFWTVERESNERDYGRDSRNSACGLFKNVYWGI